MTKRNRVLRTGLLCLVLGSLLLTSACVATDAPPNVTPKLFGMEGATNDTALGLQIITLLTALTLIPAMLMMASSFTRIVIVLSFIRNAIGVPQTPPNQILLGLTLFLTIFVMAPVWQNINAAALQPYLKNEISQDEAVERGMAPMRTFMFKQTREKDLSLFVYLAKMDRPKNQSDIPTHVLIPAFVISELKTAFQMGFLILVPFLIIDMIVSSTLMSMGMMMLPPAVISLPFKILLFVLVDGWHLVVRSLMVSFS
ncbi:MAG: flagellar type III secretion system pore protein FliP [Bacteroidetes bacterium]|nr:flagellar type III secretion system pore protein FliP [Bacteroidota bacterium]MCL5027297.1 flagellar type III secretion system pore protein FliP [Chloroflexota bacterium]